MKLLRTIAVALFLLVLPLLLVLTNLRWIALSPATYENGYARYGAARTTGMSPQQLSESARQIIDYFEHGKPITLEIRKEWGSETLFNAREMSHLADVRGLFQLAFTAQLVVAGYVGLFVLLGLIWHAWHLPSTLNWLARWAFAGGLLTLGAFALFGVAAAADFDSLFLRFHLMSFSNDLWQLDPRTDYMIRMFPQGFWFETALRLVMWTMAEAVALVAVGWGFLRWQATRLQTT